MMHSCQPIGQLSSRVNFEFNITCIVKITLLQLIELFITVDNL